MPKRKREETKEERWSRKLKKYEEKLQETQLRHSQRKQRIVYSSDENDVQPEEHRDPGVADTADVNRILLCHESTVLTDDGERWPGTDEATVVETTTSNDFDIEILQVLGDIEPETVEYADDLHNDIATRFQIILVSGLKKDVKEELSKKYIFPKNVPFAKAPTLNPEIEAMLPETCRLRDKRLLSKQDQLGRALSALGKAMTNLLRKTPNISEVVRILNDAGKLIADSHYTETDTRRSVIIPLVDKSLTDPFKNRKRDLFLFGESLGEVVKNSRGIKKTSQLIQAVPSTSNSGLNYKSPSIRPRQQWVSQTYPQHRAGGQQTAYSNRWRAAPGPPPPARRQPPPPPPPRRQPAPRQRATADRPQK